MEMQEKLYMYKKTITLQTVIVKLLIVTDRANGSRVKVGRLEKNIIIA